MSNHVLLLSIPGLRERDLEHMNRLRALVAEGDRAALIPSTPAVTCPVQVNMTTGVTAAEHGVVANGFYWRDRAEVEMWTAWNSVIERPQIWDRLHEADSSLTSAVWFPLLAKGCGADFICTPAPIHNPDGSESLWCYTKPESLYGELLESLGHFPLQHFWGPLANIEGSRWIVSSALEFARREQPNFFYIYLPHLDYAAQKYGPDSPEAIAACQELDQEIGRLREGIEAAWSGVAPLWMVASEYAITSVSHVAYPNRLLRDAGLLRVTHDEANGELIDFKASDAWALCDHQHAHLFVRDRNKAVISQVTELFKNVEGVSEVWDQEEQRRHGLWHERSGDVVLNSEPHSWFAYYYWLDEAQAPAFARKVDIHRKPGYDPVEMFWDGALASEFGSGVPLDAGLIRGSHGAPSRSEDQQGVMLTSQPGVIAERAMADVDVFGLVLSQFGV